MDAPSDIRQVRVPTVAVGLVLSVAAIVGTVTWNSARLVSRIDQLEATVESIEESIAKVMRYLKKQNFAIKKG